MDFQRLHRIMGVKFTPEKPESVMEVRSYPYPTTTPTPTPIPTPLLPPTPSPSDAHPHAYPHGRTSEYLGTPQIVSTSLKHEQRNSSLLHFVGVQNAQIEELQEELLLLAKEEVLPVHRAPFAISCLPSSATQRCLARSVAAHYAPLAYVQSCNLTIYKANGTLCTSASDSQRALLPHQESLLADLSQRANIQVAAAVSKRAA